MRRALLLLPILLCGCAGAVVGLPVRQPLPLPPSTTRDDVLRAWGPSPHKRLEGDTEVWRYRGDLLWIGVIPVVGLPLPLGTPLGHEWVEFRFSAAVPVSATERTTRSVGGVCGLLPGPCTLYWGCDSASD